MIQMDQHGADFGCFFCICLFLSVCAGEVSLGDAWGEREDLKRHLPKELVLTIKLPLMVCPSAAACVCVCV